MLMLFSLLHSSTTTEIAKCIKSLIQCDLDEESEGKKLNKQARKMIPI